ncbi:hypothetical protein Bca4012_008884 [Brassica carinata]|uniref:Uncharacterized protein n=1 Tax=Brassica carinata TaxID=52824 RepID=A0A8X7V3P6_BRACI|nr:hypothetical protein Bca52824_037419 [Brassica carinata]
MGNTLFWCTLSKGPDYKISSTFDAYVEDNSKHHGGSYEYIASDVIEIEYILNFRRSLTGIGDTKKFPS